MKQLSRAHSFGVPIKWEVCACLHLMLETMQLPRPEKDKLFFINSMRLNYLAHGQVNLGNPQTIPQPFHEETRRNMIGQNASFIHFLRESVPLLRRNKVGPRLDFFSSMLPLDPINGSQKKNSYASVVKNIISQ